MPSHSQQARQVKNQFTGKKITVGSYTYNKVKKFRQLSKLNVVALKTINPTSKRNVKVFGNAHLRYIYHNIPLGQYDNYLNNYKNKIYLEDQKRKLNEYILRRNEDILKVKVINNQMKLLKQKKEIAEKKLKYDMKVELIDMIRKSDDMTKKMHHDIRKADLIDMMIKNANLTKKLHNDIKQFKAIINNDEPLKYRWVFGFKNSANTAEILSNNRNDHNLDKFLSDCIRPCVSINNLNLNKLKGIKVYNVVKVTMMKESDDGYIYSDAYFHGSIYSAFSNIGMVQTIINSNKKIHESFDSYLNNGSGWILERIQKMYVNTVKYNPLHGSSYKELPNWIKNTKSCINVKNSDNKCFEHAIVAGLNPGKKNPNRVSNYKKFPRPVMDGIAFPVKKESFPRFEKINDISINVLYTNNKRIIPLYRTLKKKDKHVDLLLHDEHYVWVKNISALLNNNRSHKHKKFYCVSCLLGFHSQERLDQHIERKCDIMAQVEIPSKKDAFIKFKSIKKQLDVPFVGYADFESITEPEDKNKGRMNIYQNHKACSYGIVFVSRFEKYKSN